MNLLHLNANFSPPSSVGCSLSVVSFSGQSRADSLSLLLQLTTDRLGNPRNYSPEQLSKLFPNLFAGSHYLTVIDGLI